MKKRRKQAAAIVMAAAMALLAASCGQEDSVGGNLVMDDSTEKTSVLLFAPMERSRPDVQNVARTAFDKTVIMAEEQLNVRVEYNTYTAKDYQEKSYDDVALDRIQHGMDDFYLLNPDVLQKMGEEGRLADLSGLDCAKNLREVVKTANTVDGKLVGIPQEVVVYGLFVNKDMFDQYKLKLPNTPEEFDYMRGGFAYLKELMDRGYIDAKTAYTYEAIDGEGPDFLAQKTPIVMAYWGAANSETAYGKPDFNMQVIGFPSERGQMPIVSMTGISALAGSERLEEVLNVMDVMLSDEALQVYAETNQVISPSKNVEVDCVPALKPLNDLVNEGTYVLAGNAGMKVEQWGNTCLIVRKLLEGASVDECMAEFDRLQEETLP